MRAAKRPVVFTGCIELRETLDLHAQDERELLERLEAVPADSVFFHTFGYVLRHRAFTTAYGNDFARWAAVELGDRALGERLAVVDPFAFPRLAALRAHLVTILRGHLHAGGGGGRVEFDRAFHSLAPETLGDVLSLDARDVAGFTFPDDVWACVVYDFALGHHHRVVHREHLLHALVPLFLGRAAAFVVATRRGDAAAETARDAVGAAFERRKRYLVDRWR